MRLDFDRSAVLHKRSKRSEGILSMEDKRSNIALSLIPRRKFRRALDIGCGLGVMLEKLSQISEEVVGLDIVNNTKTTKLILFDLNLGKLPFKDELFDLIVCTEVLEHLCYPHQVLKEISRILIVDEYFVVGLPNSYNIIDLFKIIRGKPLPELDFDAYGHHVFTSIEQNLDFIKREFDIIDLTYHYIKHKYVSKFAKRFGYRSIVNRWLAYSVFALCKKRD